MELHRTGTGALRRGAWATDARSQRIASGSVDQTAHVWAVDSGKTTVPSQAAWNSPTSNELKGHSNSVDQLTWDPTHPDLCVAAQPDHYRSPCGLTDSPRRAQTRASASGTPESARRSLW